MDYKTLKRQILIELRGPLSQLEFSQKLGYTFNQVGKWESSATRIKWTEFCDICALSGIALDDVFYDVFHCMNRDMKNTVNVLNAIHVFHSSYSFDKLSQLLHCHVSVVRRWFRGAVCPDLESVLALIDLREGFLSLFVSRVVNIKNIPIMIEQHQFDSTLRDQASLDPDMTVIELCLGLDDYKNLPAHSDQFVSDHSGLPVPEVKRRIQILLDAGRVVWRDGKIIAISSVNSNLTGDVLSFTKMQKHWVQKMLKRFDTPDGVPVKKNKDLPSHQACFVFNAGKEEMFQIQALLNKCFEDIRQLIHSPGELKSQEEVRVLMMSFFCPNDIPMEASTFERPLPKSFDVPSGEHVLQ